MGNNILDTPKGQSVESLGVKYSIPEYTKDEVKIAGAVLVDKTANFLERAKALVIVDNWRSAHAYPLQTTYVTLFRRAKKVDANVLTAQRRKRLASIENKLILLPHLKLTNIQDIGGCRAILDDVKSVRKLATLYDTTEIKNPHDRPQRIKVNDYIETPKTSGYRSLHYVYEYNTSSPDYLFYKGLRIEIQIRSKLQHIWATAVETISEFIGFALKSNIGDEHWKRFFVLMSNVIALKERCPRVPNTPNTEKELKEELRYLCDSLKILDTLAGCSAASQLVIEEASTAHNFLLKLDSSKKEVLVTPFMKNEQLFASSQVLTEEEKYRDNPEVQVVLVSVSSVHNLRRAYPNYFLDIKEFSVLVNKAIA